MAKPKVISVANQKGGVACLNGKREHYHAPASG